MLIFLDTEYTGLGQRKPKLISLGIVSEDGRREFYVELADTWQLDDCSDFVKREVLPLLQGPAIPISVARECLVNWLGDAPRSLQSACDSARDFEFLLYLLGDVRPRNLKMTCYDLRPLIDTTVYHRAVMAHFQSDNREHHALVDARAYRKGWLAWMDARKNVRVR
jgi:DNA polymerase III epsilon subunit-like protein